MKADYLDDGVSEYGKIKDEVQDNLGECPDCGSQELMEGNPYHEHITFKCEDCGNERTANTNGLRPAALKY